MNAPANIVAHRGSVATDPERINKAVRLTLPALSEDEGQALRDAATGRIAVLAGEGAK